MPIGDTFPSFEEQASGAINPSIQRPSLAPTNERDVIKRYTRVFRAADTAMLELFNDVQLLTAEGELIQVPIIYGTQERAVAAMLGKSLQTSGDVTRVKLPMMAISSNGFEMDRTRYTFHEAVDYSVLNARSERTYNDVRIGMTRGIPINRAYSLMIWTKFNEDMNQVLEQVLLKFSPVAYVDVANAYWENIVTLDGLANNITYDVADQDMRIIKYEVQMTLQTYIPQPLKRTKSVKTVNIDVVAEPTHANRELDPFDLPESQLENIRVQTDDGEAES